MPDHPSYRRALRLLEDEIARLKSETLPQLTLLPSHSARTGKPMRPTSALTRAKLRLQQLYEKRRRLRGEL